MIAFGIACLGLVLVGLPDGALGVAWPSLRTSLGASNAGLGLILICSSTGTFCAGLMSGRVLQAHGLRRTLTASALAAGCGLAVIAAAPSMTVLCGGALLLGVGVGMIDSGVNTAGAMSFDARRINWMHGCYALGAMAGPVAMTAIIVQAGLSWRLGYVCLALAPVAASVLFARRTGSPLEVDRAVAVGGGAWNALRHPLVQLQIVLFFVYTGVESVLGQWSYTILTDSRGLLDSVAGLCAGAYWGSLAGGRFLLGMAVSRVGADRLLRGCTIAVVVGALVFAFAPGLWGAGGLMIAGFALAPVFPTLMARAPERLGHSVAVHAIGFKVSAAMVGGALFPAMGGMLADAAGLRSIGWFAAGGAVVLFVLHEALLAAASPPRSQAGVAA